MQRRSVFNDGFIVKEFSSIDVPKLNILLFLRFVSLNSYVRFKSFIVLMN